ncbi:hypothetical protein HNQ44_002805 [Planomicrobium koreense]|uniref:Uncharacterized protein n=1 Tax=Planococcus koreensis TaxID=112331 RepID=A0A7W8CWM3_9BACL|nr:hypothetical protein [Planococcus koreensis]MBB5181340.1 hypothetical protein [Planococcus koreensis]
MANEHMVSLIDFVARGSSLYIQLSVYDAETGREFREEVRFLGDLLYGELVHPERSPLSDGCRQYTITYLKDRFNR